MVDFEEDGELIMYKDRKEWVDIVPKPQDDGPYPVVRIAYPETFTDVYNYFRAVVEKGELSKRALTLTEDAIMENAANYTVWQYRRKIIKHIKYDLNEELDFCRDMIEQNPKNYQVWHHRRVIVEWLKDPSKELRLTQIIFAQDAKNYHAWEHRQWVLSTFDLFDAELEFVESLLQEDIRNNSAWNQRYFTICRTTGFTDDVISREVDFTLKAIQKVINNESPWNYLKGVLVHSSRRLCEQQTVEQWCWKEHRSKDKTCHFVLVFLVDVLEDRLDATTVGKKENLEQALELCDCLANESDKIRHQYWSYIARSLATKYKQ